jgi:hypothetical protein
MADAPRLRAYWGNQNEPLVGVAPRFGVNLSSVQDDGTPVRFDVSNTPIGNVTRDRVVLDSFAWRIDSATVRIAVFRDDPKDGAAERVNQDQYDIVTDIERHSKFHAMISPASTSYNGNMREFCSETLAFTKRKAGDGFLHRMPTIPTDVTTVITRTS